MTNNPINIYLNSVLQKIDQRNQINNDLTKKKGLVKKITGKIKNFCPKGRNKPQYQSEYIIDGQKYSMKNVKKSQYNNNII